MAEFSDQKKKKKYKNALEEKPQVLSVNFYGALKSKNEIYFQMASLFKAVTQAEKIKMKKIKNQMDETDFNVKFFRY